MGINTHKPTESFSRNSFSNYKDIMKTVYRKGTRRENHQKNPQRNCSGALQPDSLRNVQK